MLKVEILHHKGHPINKDVVSLPDGKTGIAAVLWGSGMFKSLPNKTTSEAGTISNCMRATNEYRFMLPCNEK